MSSSEKLSWKGTLRQVFNWLRPPPILGFCLGWSSDLVGSYLVRYRVVNSCRIWSSTGLNIPHPLPALQCLYILNFDTGKWKGGRVEPERRLEGQQFTKLGRKYPHDWLYLQSISSGYTCRKVFLHVNFFRRRHFALVSIKLISRCEAPRNLSTHPLIQLGTFPSAKTIITT
jgi:hypothetical protein